MKVRALTFATVTMLIASMGVSPADAGQIYSVTYADISAGTTTDLTTAGTLDWVKWGNGEANNSVSYSTPEKTGGTIIDPALTALGSVPQGQTVTLETFTPVAGVTPAFTWTDGTKPMAGGSPVGTSVSETILPAQFSYPLGLGASFQVTAAASPQLLTVYVAGFDARMKLTATLSDGTTASLIASNAALIPVSAGSGDNYFSYGIFSIDYAGAGETLTISLTADDQSGIPTDAPQYVYRNAGVMAATVNVGFVPVPEPSSLILSAIGIAGLFGYRLARRRTETEGKRAV
ncbi:MAG: PEP-CTERM sorting domain-containing protein [Isosphaeraceae bacterium]